LSEWETTLRELRRTFLERAPGLIDDVEAALDARIRGDGSLADLRAAFHKIAGSAGTYRFPDIAQAAEYGEGFCRTHEPNTNPPGPADIATWRHFVRQLREAVEAARFDFDCAETARGIGATELKSIH